MESLVITNFANIDHDEIFLSSSTVELFRRDACNHNYNHDEASDDPTLAM